MIRKLLPAFSASALFLASCAPSQAGDSPPAATVKAQDVFTITAVARFNEPWAMAFIPGTPFALITEKSGQLKLWQADGPVRDVSGVPAVAYGGQGGLGDVVLAPDYAGSGLIYLSYAEAGDGDTRGAAVARAKLVLGDAPRLEAVEMIWRQSPKVTGRGHYSHRIAFSPDGKQLFIASGERQKMSPAQDLSGNLGKVIRLNLDGAPATGNPFAAQGGVAAQIWSLGHRNILGLAFDAQGRLWGLEHGPAGGDELNLLKPGANYGWPRVSNGSHYDGRAIPDHAAGDGFAGPAISWNPVIAPGNMLFYSGAMFPEWRGQVLIAGLGSQGLLRVSIQGTAAKEEARYSLGNRVRAVAQAEDGALWVLEDGTNGRLLRLSAPKR